MVLISAAKLERFWGLHPSTIVHIGAHHAEELVDYERMGWGSESVVWVEAMPASLEFLRAHLQRLPHHELVDALAWDVSGQTVTFSIASNSESSSALPMKEHLALYPHVVVESTVTLTTTALCDAVDFARLDRIDLVNLDIQGAELRALQGFEAELWRVQAIYSEVNVRELYEGCALLPQMDSWLQERGFIRVDWELLPAGWGDALWLRAAQVPRFTRIRRRLRKLTNAGPRLDAFARRIARRVLRR